MEAARPLIEGKHHQLTVDTPAHAISVHADPLRLAQILSNLLTNAAKYTDSPGSIRLQAWQSGDELLIDVTDSGIGIAPEDQAKLFKMFTQVASAEDRSEGGLGIGLALTKGLVELHGEIITVASAGRGRGSCFSTATSIISRKHSTAYSPMAAPGLSRRSRRILIADDNRDAADSLAITLQALGHEAITAYDGERALQLWDEESPDALLLDIGMPKLSGYEIAKRIRARDMRVLLIAISGWGLDADKERARLAGFDHHFTKPVDHQLLADILASDNTSTPRPPDDHAPPHRPGVAAEASTMAVDGPVLRPSDVGHAGNAGAVDSTTA